MKVTNKDIRDTAKLNGIKLWQIGDALGMTDATFSRKLRHEFSDEQKARIYDIIDVLAREGE